MVVRSLNGDGRVAVVVMVVDLAMGVVSLLEWPRERSLKR